MRPVLAIFVMSLICSVPLNAQRETAIWYFGSNAGLDFNSGNPIPLFDGALDTTEGCATISDASGNLLFYTNGLWAWNRDHQVMPNGSGLLGSGSSTQSAIIVPAPQNPGIYYLFTVRDLGNPPGLNYSVVDMSLDGGLGDITSQKNIQLEPRVAEKLTAVQHANGRDIWVLAHEVGSNGFLAYLVTPLGVSNVAVRSYVGLSHLDTAPYFPLGAIKASPDGSMIACAVPNYALELFDFDAGTGVVGNPRILAQPGPNIGSIRYYGVEFSPDSRLLYASEDLVPISGNIYQYDTAAPDPAASRTLVHDGTTVPYNLVSTLQLGFDGKIYAAINDQGFLAVIEDPNVPGLGCNLVYQGIDLGGRISRAGLPQFIQSFFAVSIEATDLCLGNATSFSLFSSEPIVSALWDFGDGNTSTTIEPTHTYGAPGNYTVSVQVQTATNSKSETREITISPQPTAFDVADVELCFTGSSFSLELDARIPEVLGSQDPVLFDVSFHSSPQDAQSGLNPLPSTYSPTANLETLFVRIASNGNPLCYDTTSFVLDTQQAPNINPPSDWTVCDSDRDASHTFDLRVKDSEILSEDTAGMFQISYHRSMADAEANAMPLPKDHSISTARETLFFRVGNVQNPLCQETGSFDLLLVRPPEVGTVSDIILCPTIDGAPVLTDLSQKDNELLGIQSASDFLISYHRTPQDAESGENDVPKSDYVVVGPQETLYARMWPIGNETCFEVLEFQILVNAPLETDLQETYVICPDQPNLQIDGGAFDSWQWQDGEGNIIGTARYLDIPSTGSYGLAVTRTENGLTCTLTSVFEVVSSAIPESISITTSGGADQIVLTVEAGGDGNFEYSLDGLSYQQDNTFTVFPGRYNAFVRDVFGCRTLSQPVVAIGYQRFFTPNGDNVNESWNIIGAEEYADSPINIYDRYGRLLDQINPDGSGWDGTYRGNPLPSSDYWFRFEYGQGQVLTGHFTLKR